MGRASLQERGPAERKLRRAQQALQEIARATDAGRVAIDPDRAAAEAHERAVRELLEIGRVA